MKLPRTILLPALAAVVSIAPLCHAAEQEQQQQQLQPPQPAKPTEPAITRVYDVRELIAPTYEFPVTTSTYARAFIAPAGQSINASQMNGGTTSTNQLFQNANGQPVANTGAVEESKSLTNELIKMIQDTIATETWRDNGGALGVLRDLKGMLVITQTEANHKKIAELLGDLSREQGGMVRVTADWVLLSSADAAKMTKKPGGSDDAMASVDPAFLQNLPTSVKHFSGQTLSRNGQTVYVISGMDRSMVTSAVPVVGTGVAAYATDVSNVGSGIALEVNTRVNWDTKSAVVTLFSTFSDPVKVNNDSVSVGIATTQPGGPQVTLLPPTAAFQPFSRVIQDLRTTVRLPLGATIVAGGMTLNAQTQAGDEQQLLLILKVTASK